MRAYIITLKGNQYSENMAARCVMSAKKLEANLNIELFPGVDANKAYQKLKDYNLKWTWENGKICPHTGLYMKPYGYKDVRTKIGCSISHYNLWNECTYRDEPILILEHDAVFVHTLPDIDFKFACQINDPDGATPKGKWWSDKMKKRGQGLFPKTIIPYPDNRPDGLAGNGSYLITPKAADKLIHKTKEIGLWINDAFLCRQLFPDLEEYYPFITKIKQQHSTTSR